MKSYLDTYEVEIDHEAFQKTRNACLPFVQNRVNMYEEHLGPLFLKILVQEMKYFIIFLPLALFFSLCFLLHTKYPYSCLALISSALAILCFGELVRSYYYHMEEIQHPTKLGVSRLFLYKVLLLSLLQLAFLGILIGCSMISFQVNLSFILIQSILPCFLIPSFILQIAHKLPSLFATIAILLLAFILYHVSLQYLFTNYLYLWNQIALFASLGSILYYIFACIHVNKKLCQGGKLQWNS